MTAQPMASLLAGVVPEGFLATPFDGEAATLAFLADARTADAQWAAQSEELSSDADPAEAARLRERLAKMRTVAMPAVRQDQMTRLLEQQLELHEQACARRKSVQARRDRLRDGCALIWRQLCGLRADESRRAEPNEITGRLRAIVADLQRLRDAADDVDGLPGTDREVT